MGIRSDTYKNHIEIYPNPASTELNIELPDENKDYTLSIYDLNGRKLGTHSLLQKNSKIDVKNYQPGIYVLKFAHKNNVEVQRIIINREKNISFYH